MTRMSKKMRFWLVLSIVGIAWSWFWIAGGALDSESGALITLLPGAIAIIGWAIWWIRKGK